MKSNTLNRVRPLRIGGNTHVCIRRNICKYMFPCYGLEISFIVYFDDEV